MDTSGLPVPDAIHPLLEQLHEALLLEVKYQPNLHQLPTTTQVRDGGSLLVFDDVEPKLPLNRNFEAMDKARRLYSAICNVVIIVTSQLNLIN